ncbi:MAG: glutamate formimidoyltransferase [Desulfobacteraceae bacterium 4572_88]|nr:MAG: glutamate formimidoyltransferase [Desulfobacteraceae bacterium 4572_88]
MKKILECVPNFSEGRDSDKIERIVNPFRGRKKVKLLDYQRDEDHNRMVVTAVGEPESLRCAVMEAMGIATECIDMRLHRGQHPRMGATDVIPFIPIRNIGMAEAAEVAGSFARQAAEKYQIPVFLYEKSASSPHRENLSNIRKGQFEGMAEKMRLPQWKPDFGPETIHPGAGVTAVGARMPLVAFNVNLNTDNPDVASAIAKKVRHISGGLRYCKGIGVELRERGIVQISMNMTDFSKTSLYAAFELVSMEAKRHGLSVTGSEIVGLVPMAALTDAAAYYLRLENFSTEQVLEAKITE